MSLFPCVYNNSFQFWLFHIGFHRLLVGAPYEMNGPYQTGDIYKCSLSKRTNGNGCSKLNLGIVSLYFIQFLVCAYHKPHHYLSMHVCTACTVHMCVDMCMHMCVCVLISVTVAWERHKCGYHAIHSLFYNWFYGLCTFPCVLYHTCDCMSRHMEHICAVLVR